jgi:DnaJ family protein A protein 2
MGGGSKDTKLYDTLGISKTANETEIKKAYRKLAMENHPDKNPGKNTEEKFKEISKAYDILKDAEKRKQYDSFGLEAVNQVGAGGGGSPFDMFNDIFGGMGGMGRRGNSNTKRYRRGGDRVEQIELRLEDFYKCKPLNIRLKKQILCGSCIGTGAENPGDIQKCDGCDGSGIILKIQTLGPGLITQSQRQCDKCIGKGKRNVKNSMCEMCVGKGLLFEKKEVKIELKGGMKSKEKVVFTGEGNQEADLDEYGDLIIIINCKIHPDFNRKGNDLYIKKTIFLTQALCGSRFQIIHLDDRKLVVDYPGIIKPGERFTIKNEGMPLEKNGDFGDLYIDFEIEFPSVLGEEHKKYISKLIPGKQEDISDDIISLKMEPYNKDLLDTEDLEDNEINLEDQPEGSGEQFEPGNCATQ